MSRESPFERIRARWLLALLAGTYVAATFVATSLHDPGAAWYWSYLLFFYVWHASLAAPVLCHALTNAIAWGVNLAEHHVRGPDHVYSLQEFVGEWWIAAAAGVVSARWVVRFVARHGRLHRRPPPTLA